MDEPSVDQINKIWTELNHNRDTTWQVSHSRSTIHGRVTLEYNGSGQVRVTIGGVTKYEGEAVRSAIVQYVYVEGSILK